MNRARRHEPDVVDAARIARLGAVFALALALLLGLMYLLWRPLPGTAIRPAAVPPRPRLQDDPRRDLIAAQQAQRQRLQAYGWDDPQHRFAHVPVERAMAVMAGAASTAPAEHGR